MAEIRSSPKAHTITWPFSAKTAEDLDYNFDVLIGLLGTVIERLNALTGAVDEIPTDGVAGAAGPMGPFGVDGEEGAEGPIGPPGMTGARGPAGSAASLPYWFDDEGDYPETLPHISLLNPNCILETSIIDGALLARNAANEIITGSWTFTGGAVAIQNNTVQVQLNEPDAAADEKWWRLLVDAGELNLQTIDDAFSASGPIATFGRSGTIIDSIKLYINGALITSWSLSGALNHLAALNLSGNLNASSNISCSGSLSVSANASVAGGFYLPSSSGHSVVADETAMNPSGLGTVFFIGLVPTAVWNIRGILSQAHGYLVAFFNIGSPVNLTHQDAAASAADRLWLPNAATLVLPTYGTVVFEWHAGLNGWYLVSKSF